MGSAYTARVRATAYDRHGSRRQAWLLAPVSVALLAAACSLDRRSLSVGPADDRVGGGGGDPFGAMAGESGAPPGGLGGPGRLVDGCADLDTDGVSDCKVTRVKNPTFGGDVSGWLAESGAELRWDPKNALEDVPSGSAKLTTTAPQGRAQQCVVLADQRLVITYASVLVETMGRAQLEASFFDTPDCSGERSRYFETPPSQLVDTWATVQAGGLAPLGSRSVSLALVGLNLDAPQAFAAYFDNVMLKTTEP